MLVLTLLPASSQYITAALLSFLLLSSSNSTGWDGLINPAILEASHAVSFWDPSKNPLITAGIAGVPVTWLGTVPSLLHALCNLHSWRQEVECPQADAGVFTQSPPRLALVSPLICSVVTWPLPPEPGLTAHKPVTVFFFFFFYHPERNTLIKYEVGVLNSQVVILWCSHMKCMLVSGRPPVFSWSSTGMALLNTGSQKIDT